MSVKLVGLEATLVNIEIILVPAEPLHLTSHETAVVPPTPISPEVTGAVSRPPTSPPPSPRWAHSPGGGLVTNPTVLHRTIYRKIGDQHARLRLKWSRTLLAGAIAATNAGRDERILLIVLVGRGVSSCDRCELAEQERTNREKTAGLIAQSRTHRAPDYIPASPNSPAPLVGFPSMARCASVRRIVNATGNAYGAAPAHSDR